MEKYLKLLIETLREAYNQKPSPRYLELPKEMESLRDVIDMEMSMQEDEHTLESIFGVSQLYFPPVEKLTDRQVKRLVKEILALWRIYHYEADLPPGIPARYAYPVLLSCWKITYPVLKGSGGVWHIELCHYDPKECPFPQEFCQCKNY